MKKFNISFIILLLCSILMFTGCTKAKNATPETVNTLYSSWVTKYGTTGNSTKIFASNGFVDLYSINSYGSRVYQSVTQIIDEGSYSMANMLQKGYEYDTMMSAVSSFYKYRTFIVSFVDIPQNLVSKMYQEIDDLDGYLKETLRTKNAFIAAINDLPDSDINSKNIRESLKNYLKAYGNLIEQFFRVNAVYEEIYTSYIYVPQDTTTVLREGELQRLVLSASLYMGEYYYLKHLVLDTNLDSRFAHSKIFNTETNEVYNNPYYDSAFATFRTIVENFSYISDPANLSDYNLTSYYNASVDKLKTFKTNINNYKVAVQKVADFNRNNKSNTPIEESNVYQYAQFIEFMDTEVESFQNYLLHNIMQM